MNTTRRLRIVLGLLLAVAGLTQVLATRDALRGDRSEMGEARAPVVLNALSRSLVALREEAIAAGLVAEDRIEAIDGVPVVGLRDATRALTGRRAGQPIAIVAAGRDGARKTATVVAAAAPGSEGTTGWILVIALSVVVPALCVGLGFWVALARPRDARAWLLLGLLLGFSVLVNADTSGWPPVLGEIGAAWRMLLRRTWPIWMMTFGLTFPRPFAGLRRWRWAVGALAGLFAIDALWRSVASAIAASDLDAAEALVRPLAPTERAVAVLTYACVGLFFASLGYRSGTARDPDDRRRLRLLWAGTSLALTPLFVLVMATLVRGGGDLTKGPAWLVVPSLLLLQLFPLTLAYVIVVERAMDVRVVVRLGVQYALARRGGTLLLAAAGIALATAISRIFVRDEVGVIGKAALAAIYFALLFAIFKTSRRFKTWVDRRFFRDAYDAELILTELADNVGTIVDRRELLDTVARRIATALHVPRVAVLVPDPGGLQTAHSVGFTTKCDATLPLAGAVAKHLTAASLPAPVWPDDPGGWLRNAGASASEIATLRDLDARLLVPAHLQGRLVGVLCLAPKLSEEPYSIVDQRMLRTVAAQIALALEHARLTEAVVEEARRSERLRRDVEIAREVQESLFPKVFPVVPGLEIAGACRPAQGVGGDYFDVLSLPDGRIGFAIADVSGKGIAAALLMSALQASLRGQAVHPELDLATLMTHVNRLVHDASPSNRYATFFYAQYDPATLRLDFVNAGHNPPIVLRRRNDTVAAIRLERCGTVVGMFPDSTWKPASIALEPGDVLVGFTDGVSEAMDRDDEEWGEERLLATLRSCDDAPVAQVISRVMAAADAFVAGAPQYDDMTLIVVRIGAP